MLPEATLRSDAFRSLSAAALRVYSALALHANASRESWPSTQTLSDVAGVDERTVTRAINKMVSVGLVSKSLGGGRNRTNRYRLIDQPGRSNNDAWTPNPGNVAGVYDDSNSGEVAGVSSEKPGSSVHKPRQPRRGNIQEQLTCHGDGESARVVAVRASLADAGVTGPNLDRLAELDDLTVDDVRELADVAQVKATSNPAGLLVTMITDGKRPVSQPGSKLNATNDFTRPSSREEAAHLFPTIPN